MPSCVKEKDYRWCKGEYLYRAENGEFYCIFHLPKGSPDKREPSFTEKVFTKIKDAKTKGEICNLSGTVFNDGISFSTFNKDNPLPEIDFKRAVFCGEVDFKEVVFEGIVTFEFARFEGDAYFNSAVFKKKADFSCTVFKGGGYFGYAQFEDKANFAEITFEGQAFFAEKTFLERVDFTTADTFGLIVFDRVDLKRVSFLDSDLRKVDFRNCTFPKLDRNTRVLYDELIVCNKVSVDKEEESEEPHGSESVAEKERDKIERVEILYRRLKQKYLDERDYGQASEWHLREKEMWKKRTGIREFLPFIFLRLYNISSGYGEKPGRALLFLLLIICATIWLFSICGMSVIGTQPGENQIKWPSNTDLNKTGQLFVSVFQYLTFQKDVLLKPINLGGEFVKLLSQILIPIQAALFGLAVRNRFRR
jgi:uncharacterized protein YjbI with pentapeptide repeats